VLVRPVQIDLAVTDIFPDTQPQGEAYIRPANRGPDGLEGLELRVICNWEEHPWTQPDANHVPMAANEFTPSLSPSQTEAFPTGLRIDTDANWYKIEYVAYLPGFDPNTDNNAYSEYIPQP
jgi:hypothetical protein